MELLLVERESNLLESNDDVLRERDNADGVEDAEVFLDSGGFQ